MQVCTSLQTDNHASTPPLSFLQAGCPSCRPTNSVKALKAQRAIFSELEISRVGAGRIFYFQSQILEHNLESENKHIFCEHLIFSNSMFIPNSRSTETTSALLTSFDIDVIKHQMVSSYVKQNML